MPRFKNINFYQNKPKFKLVLQENIKFSSAWGFDPRYPKQPTPLRAFGYVPVPKRFQKRDDFDQLTNYANSRQKVGKNQVS